MRNPHVARLDRQIRLHGEPVLLTRQLAGVRRHVLNTRGIVKTFAAEQLIGSITQTNYLVILSPTDLRNKGFPGAVPEAIPSGTVPPADPNLPNTGDALVIRGTQKAIGQVSAIYDGGEIVRIEIKVLG